MQRQTHAIRSSRMQRNKICEQKKRNRALANSPGRLLASSSVKLPNISSAWIRQRFNLQTPEPDPALHISVGMELAKPPDDVLAADLTRDLRRSACVNADTPGGARSRVNGGGGRVPNRRRRAIGPGSSQGRSRSRSRRGSKPLLRLHRLHRRRRRTLLVDDGRQLRRGQHRRRSRTHEKLRVGWDHVVWTSGCNNEHARGVVLVGHRHGSTDGVGDAVDQSVARGSHDTLEVGVGCGLKMWLSTATLWLVNEAVTTR